MKTATNHILPTTTKINAFRDDPGHLDCAAIILVEGSNNPVAGYGLCAWTEEGSGRLVFQGPMVQGPVATLFGRACMISTDGGTGAENRKAIAEGRLFHAAPGDTIEVEGAVYDLSLCARKYPILTLRG